MTNTMLEKAARAMAYKWFIGDFEPDAAYVMASEDVAEWVPIARAALQAIREPDDVRHLLGQLRGNGTLDWEADDGQTWTVLIGAILSEGEA